MTAEALIRNNEILGNFLKYYRQLEALFRAKACRHRLKTRLVTNNATLRKKTLLQKAHELLPKPTEVVFKIIPLSEEGLNKA